MPWNDKGKHGFRFPEMKPKSSMPKITRVKPDSPKLDTGTKVKRVKRVKTPKFTSKINYDTDDGNIKHKGKEWSNGYPKRKKVDYTIKH